MPPRTLFEKIWDAHTVVARPADHYLPTGIPYCRGGRKECLLTGLDDIDLTLCHADAIAAFEATQTGAVS